METSEDEAHQLSFEGQLRCCPRHLTTVKYHEVRQESNHKNLWKIRVMGQRHKACVSNISNGRDGRVDKGETGCRVWIFGVGLHPNHRLTRQCESQWENFG
ncbi:hypothetical protein TNCV_4416211 [Trichonephila clavipes]|uniref:Uncharacterized protein n=1 Tax=Trichonephila clavipes TaxID=2585209 RepID=A0A8X6S9R5_TRICX|nr:hypothetical protein TNCV_4416211 [Trichonephila clavipes]